MCFSMALEFTRNKYLELSQKPFQEYNHKHIICKKKTYVIYSRVPNINSEFLEGAFLYFI